MTVPSPLFNCIQGNVMVIGMPEILIDNTEYLSRVTLKAVYRVYEGCFIIVHLRIRVLVLSLTTRFMFRHVSGNSLENVKYCGHLFGF